MDSAPKEQTIQRIQELVASYNKILQEGKKDSFNEERVKIAFILPLLEALGWNPRTDEVLPEQATLTGRADFGLRINGRTKIYVEVKSFKRNLDGFDTIKGVHRSFAEQAIHYAWSMKANWAVLTNFEEIRLYNSLVKKPERGLVWKPIKFNEIEKRFEDLWLISKQSAQSGQIEIASVKADRNPIDETFLKDLIKCRQLLANDIKMNNKLSLNEINDDVQKILDRLIFIKNCEDRLIIPAEWLWKRFESWRETAIDKNIVTFIMDLKNSFRYFDEVYNGKLFEKHPCEDLKISNQAIEEIINVLYGSGEHIGYNFSVIPMDVLGQAYEMYIGSIIHEKTENTNVMEIIGSPARRKAHGIYYTPEYIVDYIVRNTLGKLLDACKTPEEVSKIKVLDPSCGSGSFLIKAFDVFKEWYVNFNRLNQTTANRSTLDAHFIPIPNIGERILRDNLYGVDNDPQAVEIAILNLSLKSVETKKKLPYMGDHIKCGDSLLSGSQEEIDKYFVGPLHKKAFVWETEFPDIVKQGGFDIIIGNPPYVGYKKIPQQVKDYFEFKYPLVFTGENDYFYYFIMKGIDILKAKGQLGFIIGRYFLEAKFAKKLRKYILENTGIREVIDFRNVKIFEGATNNTCILILDKPKTQSLNHDQIQIVTVKKEKSSNNELMEEIVSKKRDLSVYSSENIEIFPKSQSTLTDDIWKFEPESVEKLLRKIGEGCETLDFFCDVGTGIQTGKDEVFCWNLVEAEGKVFGNLRDAKGKIINKLPIENSLLRKIIKNGSISRYGLTWEGFYLLLTNGVNIEDYPSAKEYLEFYENHKNKKFNLEERYERRKNQVNWYELSVVRNKSLFENASEKLICPYKGVENIFALDNQKLYCSVDCTIVVPKENSEISIKFILALLNSKLLNFYFKHDIAKQVDALKLEYYPEPVSKMRIKRVDMTNLDQKAKYDKIIDCVNRLQSLISQEKILSDKINTFKINETTLSHDYYKTDLLSSLQAWDNPGQQVYISSYSVFKSDGKLILTLKYSLNKETDSTMSTPLLFCINDPIMLEFYYQAFKNNDFSIKYGYIKNIILSMTVPLFDNSSSQSNYKILREIIQNYHNTISDFTHYQGLTVDQNKLDEIIDQTVFEIYNLVPSEQTIINQDITHKEREGISSVKKREKN